MTYPLANLGPEPDEAKELKKQRIRTVEGYLEAAKHPKGRRALEEKTGISAQRLLCLANRADRMRITGMGKEYSALLEASGCVTVRELKYRNPENLAARMSETNKKRKLVKVLPSRQLIERWIEFAKKLPPKIKYE